MKTILHIFRTYSRDSSLFNDIVRSTEGAYRNVVCYLTGEDEWRQPDGRHRRSGRLSKPRQERSHLAQPRDRWQGGARSSTTMTWTLVDCHMWRSMPIGALAAARSRHKPQVVAVFHGVKSRISLRTKLLYYFTLRRMAKIVSVSEGGVADIRSLFLGRRPRQVVRYPQWAWTSPAFLRRQTPETGARCSGPGGWPSKRLFITVSRLASKKNLERLLRAFSHVHSAYPNAGLIIVGDGPVAAHAWRHSLPARVWSGPVVFLGFREDVPSLLKNSGCLRHTLTARRAASQSAGGNGRRQAGVGLENTRA